MAATLDSGNAGAVLGIVLLCGVMGMAGQGVRAIVGLKNAGALASTTPSSQSTFSVAYLGLSLMIGFIAGIVAGFASHVLDGKANFADPGLLLGIAGSGYIGADFVENSLSLFIPASSPAPAPPSEATSPLPVTADAAVSTVMPQALPVQVQRSTVPFTTALSVTLPSVDAAGWTPALVAAFSKFDVSNNRRVAAAIGQFALEAGAAFQELVENLNYRTAERLHKVFPSRFPTVEDAEPYVGQPEKIGNKVYANKLGNGDEASGDGYRFRGRGLIQLTGRSEYEEFGATLGKTAEDAAVYCETREGAAMSGCWYLNSRGCLPLADNWQLSLITRKVNGPAMLGNEQRIAYAVSMLKHLGGT